MTWHFIKHIPADYETTQIGTGYNLDAKWKFDPVCTCGATKAAEPYPPTGHSDYCDVLNPPPETEELPF